MVKKRRRHEHCNEALLSQKVFSNEMNMLRSEWLEICRVRLNKISMRPVDFKRYTAENGIHTLVSGFRLPEAELEDDLIELLEAEQSFGGTTINSSRTKPRLGSSCK